ncbi:MAG: RNA pseudouridine synthase [Halobacteriovoraceae bacterium]|nr:RNA pseudouridine synthase [Halobacteriovoraceae bacterium]
MGKKIILKETFTSADRGVLIDFLKEELPLSGGILKECMVQGACWLKKGNARALKRVRRAKSEIRKGDYVELHYDPELFERQKGGLESEPLLIKKERDWSAWYKPAGVLTQGTKFGDSLSLLRFSEKALGYEPLLIHRLDRETDGVMVLAHNKKSAKLLSAKWQGTLVEKIYRAWVLGEIDEEEGRLDFPLEGKKAVTYFKVLEKENERTLVELRLGTGRTHQIRKHLDKMGHPIMGDPLYGRKNKDQRGLQLQAYCLVFDWHGDKKVIEVPEGMRNLDPCFRD